MYYVIVTCSSIEGYEKVPLGPFKNPASREKWAMNFLVGVVELNTELGLSDGHKIKARVRRVEFKHPPGRSRALKGWPAEEAVSHLRRRYEEALAA